MYAIFFLSALSRVEKRGWFANLLCEAALYFSAVAGVVVFYFYCVTLQLNAVLTFQEVVTMAAMIVVLIQIPRVPGMIIRHFIEK